MAPKHNLAANARGITTRAKRLTPIVSRNVEDNGPAELTGSSFKVSQVISAIIVLLHLFCTVLEVHAIYVRAGTRAYQEVIQTFSDAHCINALRLRVSTCIATDTAPVAFIAELDCAPSVL